MERLEPGLHLRLHLRQGEFSLGWSCPSRRGDRGAGRAERQRQDHLPPRHRRLARPQRGQITINGQAVLDTERRLDLPPWRRRLGVVFQDYALFPHLTVDGTALRPAGSSRRPAARPRVAGAAPDRRAGGAEAAPALGGAAAARGPRAGRGDRSGRAAPGRAVRVARRGDPAHRRSELRRFLAHAGRRGEAAPSRATLLVSHDYLDALTLGDRIAVLEGGALTQVGTREEVLRRPRTPFLAALTGHNVLRGTLAPPSPDSEPLRWGRCCSRRRLRRRRGGPGIRGVQSRRGCTPSPPCSRELRAQLLLRRGAGGRAAAGPAPRPPRRGRAIIADVAVLPPRLSGWKKARGSSPPSRRKRSTFTRDGPALPALLEDAQRYPPAADTIATRSNPVTESKRDRVRTMFGRVAKRYDHLNSVLSMGLHHRWRRFAVRECEFPPAGGPWTWRPARGTSPSS
jgi:hypothetical protein